MFNESCKLLIVCLAAVTIASAASTGKDGRIVGGKKIHIRNAPYLVQLRDQDGHFCGGTLVQPRIVITAAHCLDDMNYLDITVVGGATLTTEKGVARSVIRTAVPKEYERVVKHMDIALLLLDSDMTGENIKLMELCDKYIQGNEELQVSGWGRLTESGPYPDFLSTVSVPTISRGACKTAHKGVAIVTDSMVCGSQPGERDACSGDSGGSALVNGKLCAVVSWGIGCGRTNYPGVYTGIKEARSFIDKEISNLKRNAK